ncbi:MAG: Ig-like domain-containing protein [Myxococcota bacterium]|nr:Ig-like domain-containing protein [Myxococcota bacterium]
MPKLLLATMLAATGLGCAAEQPELGTNQGDSFEEFKAQLAREPGTGAYVLDWDLVIHGEDKLYDHWSQAQQGALLIYNNGTDIKWSDAQKVNLTYCIGVGFGANKQLIVNAMTAATVNGWEKFANVKFVYLPGQDATCNAANPNVLFDVNPAPAGSPYLARAFFPDSPRGERNVLVEAASFDPARTGGIPLANIVIHELGHALGFRHEHIARPNQQTQGCLEDTQYRGVTDYDAVSTMHYPQCGSPNNTLALSAKDQAGAALIYGAPIVNVAPMAMLTVPQNGATVAPTFDVEASVVDTNLSKAELFIDGTLYGAPLTASPWVFEVIGLAAGAHTLKIKATDLAGLIAEQEVQITVSASGGGGGGGAGAGDGDGSNDITGGCSTSGGSAGSVLMLALVGLLRRRRP